MTQFSNPEQSHEHSLEVLNLLREYDSFLDSLTAICDMGCGSGLDAKWWATLETQDDPPEPYDYHVYALDKDLSKVEPSTRATPGVRWIERNFNEECIPEKIDLLWAHDSFQYSTDPFGTLAIWNKQMTTNGMLVMAIPQNVSYTFNRPQTKVESFNYFNYSIPTLMYMLAVSGFDCKDAYFYKTGDWLYVAVYKSQDPMDPTATSLHDLIALDMFNDSVVASVHQHGYIRQEDVIFVWLDKDFYQAKL